MIYVLEDDLNIRKLITYTLQKEGMATQDFEVPSAFYNALENEVPDLCLIDIMLPEEDGLKVLERIKKDSRFRNIPCIMITARSSEWDKVTGLDAGADDYVAKPFGMMELVARIKAVLRRYEHNKNEEYHYKDLTMNIRKHQVHVGRTEIVLTKKEFEVLHILLDGIGICHTREELLNKVWGYDYLDTTRTVDVHIRTLRQKLKEAGDYIETIRGIGYKIGD